MRLPEESIDEIALTPTPQAPRRQWRRWRFIVLAVVLLMAMAMIWQRHQHNLDLARQELIRKEYSQALGAVLQNFAELQHTIANGVSYYSYTRQLGESIAATEELVRAYPKDHLPPAREAIQNSLDDYMLARECWQKKLDNRLTFVDSGSIDKESRFLPANDPLYQKLKDRYPTIVAQPDSSSSGQSNVVALDLDIAMRAAWRSADQQLARARAQLLQPALSH